VIPRVVVQGRKHPLHIGFPRRLRKARRAVGLSRAALSVEAGLSQNTAYGLESGERIPRLDTVELLAVPLRISPCALAFGIEQPCLLEARERSAGLPARLKEARALRGLSMRELGRLSETSTNLVRMTETGTTLPNLAKLEALAKALRVSPCWLGYGVGEREHLARRSSTRSAAHA
jgi:transcriptional regulator with XRE-family HTH domain